LSKIQLVKGTVNKFVNNILLRIAIKIQTPKFIFTNVSLTVSKL
jgi:hypothetical protein